MESLPPDQQHHPFVDLDVHHDAHTDAEEALEAIRVAIGQSTDFDPLIDVAHDSHSHGPASIHEQQQQTQAEDNAAAPQHSSGSSGVSAALVNKALGDIALIGSSSSSMLESVDSPEHADTLRSVIGGFSQIDSMIKDLQTQLQGHSTEFLPNIDPSLQSSYVSRNDYEAVKAKLEALSGSSQPSQPAQSKAKKRPRQSAPPTAEQQAEVPREASSTPVDEKGRKKRSMKLEHLIHQKANRRLGIEYNVSGFDSKGGRELPAPTSEPVSAADSPNGVQEFRPDFRADVNAPTVQPFLEQVAQDCTEEWEAGVGKGEAELTPQKLKESIEVYWLRLSKRWDEQTMRAQGGVHKDELVRRKQNQYRRQQSLVARRQAAFDASPLNVCKLRSMYRTLLTIDFAAKTEERPTPGREYTEDEWQAYRKLQLGRLAPEAHEIIDIYWLSPAVRAALTILDVFATDQNARIKRKGKPKTPAPGFNLPPHLWERPALPALRPKDEEGLPIPGAPGIILFRFHVDEKVIAANPDWAEGLYDNPPLPEGDSLLPALSQVMNATVYQHLRNIVRLTRELVDVPRLSAPEVPEVLNRPGPEEAAGRATEVIAACATAQPNADTSSSNLDLSLDTLVSMTQNAYMATNPLANQLASLDAQQHGNMVIPNRHPGSSQHARRMGKRSASDAPDGAIAPVAKRVKAELSQQAEGNDIEPEKDFQEDVAFLEDL